uniref:Uncharacterized protein n=1 Tax=Leersia perrieri TaxID=77586 RepID=A0A0D9XU90_9ORYZ
MAQTGSNWFLKRAACIAPMTYITMESDTLLTAPRMDLTIMSWKWPRNMSVMNITRNNIVVSTTRNSIHAKMYTASDGKIDKFEKHTWIKQLPADRSRFPEPRD